LHDSPPFGATENTSVQEFAKCRFRITGLSVSYHAIHVEILNLLEVASLRITSSGILLRQITFEIPCLARTSRLMGVRSVAVSHSRPPVNRPEAPLGYIVKIVSRLR